MAFSFLSFIFRGFYWYKINVQLLLNIYTNIFMHIDLFLPSPVIIAKQNIKNENYLLFEKIIKILCELCTGVMIHIDW